MHLLVIGGSDAGISAALRAHELDPATEITLVLADDYPNFSICGLPYFLSGETPDWHSLAHRTEFPGIDVRRRHRATAFDPAGKTATIDHDGTARTLRYDKLVVATGARPVRPDLPGIREEGVKLLHTMADSFAIHRQLEEERPRSAVIVGGGYIGIEMTEALLTRGISTTLLSRTGSVHPSVDPEFGDLVAGELSDKGARVFTRTQAAGILRRAERLVVTDSLGAEHPADLVVVAVGVSPDAELASTAGARLGHRGAIAVTRAMRTSLPRRVRRG